MYKAVGDSFNYYKKHDGRLWRKGVTTGACAAAAAKGATWMLFHQQPLTQVTITTPQNLALLLEVQECKLDQDTAYCSIVKDGGDDPDVTNGAKIIAQVRWLESGEIKLVAGEGVGEITKPGLAVSIGEPAINPVPRQMIIEAIRQVIPEQLGVEVIISVPNGKELAKKTLNSELGIIGGISILGTTGIVEPMSEEAFKYSLAQGLKIAQAQKKKVIALTPGKIGQTIARDKLGIADTMQMSNFVGFMLQEASTYEIEQVLLVGHLGKLVKVAAGNFNTHNRVSDARRETLAAHAALLGADSQIVRALMDTITTEAAMLIIAEAGLTEIYPQIAMEVSKRAVTYSRYQLQVGTILVDLAGNILGYDHHARSIGRVLGWQQEAE